MKVRAIVDTAARKAASMGAGRAGRDRLWHDRIHAPASEADHQADLAAKRAVVDAGHAKPPERACVKRPAPGADTTAQGRGPRIARLHRPEIVR
jgi:hypothetical protein